MSRQTTMSDQDADNRQMLAGASLVAASGLLFALAGVAIRLASAGLSSVEVLFWRNVLSLLILTPWIIVRWPDSIRPAHTGLIVMRGVAVVVSLLCYYYAVSVIPLAEAVRLNFSAPIFIPNLGLVLFRFTLNRAVLIAVVIGFAGAALILKPGTAFFQPAALIGLAAGVLGRLATVAVWRMPKHESAIRVAVYFALIGIVITSRPGAGRATLATGGDLAGAGDAGRLLHGGARAARPRLPHSPGRPRGHAPIHVGVLRRRLCLVGLGRTC